MYSNLQTKILLAIALFFFFSWTMNSQTSCPISSTSSTNSSTIKVDSGVPTMSGNSPVCDPTNIAYNPAICFAFTCSPVRNNFSPTIVVEKDGITYNFSRVTGITTSAAGNCEINYEPDNMSGTPNFANPYTVTFSIIPTTPCDYAAGGALPVELIDFRTSFNERRQAVDISWTTASELNNSHYEIYRLNRDFEMELIESIDGAGTTNQEVNYYFSDEYPNEGENYYLLFQEDLDGTRNALGMEVIKLASKSMEVEIYPNPVSDQLNLRFNEQTEFPIEVSIYSASGQLTHHFEVEDLSTVVPVEDLERGLYHLQINDGRNIQTKRFVKH